jgi:hypothetical protein
MTTLSLFKQLLKNIERCKELGMSDDSRRQYKARRPSEATMSRWLIKDGWEKTTIWRKKKDK